MDEGSAAGGEWPDGLVGVALSVGALHGPGPFHASMPLCPETSMDECHAVGLHLPAADVATQHHGVQRVRLRRPVERLGEVWAWDIVGCEDLEPETGGGG